MALTAGLALSAGPGWADETKATDDGLDPHALEIAGSAARFLTGQQVLSFDWFVSFDVVVEGREKITYVRSGSNHLDREAGFRATLERGQGVREYYYDGETFTMAAPGEGFYASAAFDGGFEALIDRAQERLAKDLPVWSIMSADLGQNALDRIEGAAYLGETLIAGTPAHHLAFTEYDEDWQIWIAADPERPVPLMIVSTDPYEQGWPQYRLHLLNWSFEAPEEGVAFTYEPSEDEDKVAMPTLVESLREQTLRASGETEPPAE